MFKWIFTSTSNDRMKVKTKKKCLIWSGHDGMFKENLCIGQSNLVMFHNLFHAQLCGYNSLPNQPLAIL